MRRRNKRFTLLLLTCTVVTVAAAYGVGRLDPEYTRQLITHLGAWGPLIYVIVYTVFTLLVLPSTALNLMGGAIFGPWLGTLWTTLAALLAALIAFWLARYGSRSLLKKRLSSKWQSLDTELRQGGLFYMAAIRLLPVIPYGLVNYMAGFTSIKFRDYFLGTGIGTLPGVLPFVLLGSSGVTAIQTGEILPLLIPLSLTGLLVGGATWYRRHTKSSL